MTRIGYLSSCEEHGPPALVRQARLAEEAGFDEVYIGQAGGEHGGSSTSTPARCCRSLGKGEPAWCRS